MEILFIARIAVDILFPGRSRKKIGTESRMSFKKNAQQVLGVSIYVRKKLVNQDDYFIVFHFDGSRTDCQAEILLIDFDKFAFAFFVELKLGSRDFYASFF